MFLSEMWDQNFTTEYDDKLQKFMQTMFCDRAEKPPSCKQLQIIAQFKNISISILYSWMDVCRDKNKW